MLESAVSGVSVMIFRACFAPMIIAHLERGREREGAEREGEERERERQSFVVGIAFNISCCVPSAAIIHVYWKMISPMASPV